MRSQERVNSMNDVITGIARRSAYKFKTKDANELSQELWVHILQKEEALGHEIDLDLVAKICYDKIVDIQRYDARRNISYLEEIVEMDNGDECTELPSIPNELFCNGDQFCINLMIDDLFTIFPENSKERIFLEFWGTASGVKNFNIEANGKYSGGYTESELSRLLGYAGTASGGYKKFRRKMREFVAEYFGVSKDRVK